MHLHGSAGREYATGRGVVLASRELLRAYNMGKIAGKTFVIQAIHLFPRPSRMKYPTISKHYSAICIPSEKDPC